MFAPHAEFVTPTDETVIWRYMTLDKFLALISSQSLHLTRLDQFKDPFEGCFPQRVEEAWHAQLLAAGRSLNEKRNAQQTRRDLRKSFFVNCWHESQIESAALWEQYAASGIAITSTIGRLKNCDRSQQLYSIGRVRYIDYEKFEHDPTFTMLRVACLKRISFRHEEEVRVVAMDSALNIPSQAPALSIEAPFEELVSAVWLSPLSPRWLLLHVKKLLLNFGVRSVEAKRSELYDPRLT